MAKFITIFVIVFLIVWGLGIFMGYLTGIQRVIPLTNTGTSGVSSREEQERLAAEAEEQRKRTMDDYKYQADRNKDLLKNTPSSMPGMQGF